MGVSPKPEFTRINAKETQVPFMFILSYTKGGVVLLRICFLTCPARMGEPR